MLDTQDILFIVLAFCALWFTAFVCWLVYQAASLLKRVHGLVDEVKVKLASVEDAVLGMKKKFEGNFTVVTNIAEGVRKIMDIVRPRGRDEE
jgi:hypothetical protein